MLTYFTSWNSEIKLNKFILLKQATILISELILCKNLEQNNISWEDKILFTITKSTLFSSANFNSFSTWIGSLWKHSST